MSRRTNSYAIVGTLCIGQFLAALVVASGGCDWGPTAYTLIGVISMLLVMAIPYFARRAFKRVNRLPAALGFALLALISWLMGWLIAFSRNCGM